MSKCVFCVNHSDRTNASLHEMGHFIIPTNFDPLKLQVFLQSHAPEARQRTQRKTQWVKHTTSLSQSFVCLGREPFSDITSHRASQPHTLETGLCLSVT